MRDYSAKDNNLRHDPTCITWAFHAKGRNDFNKGTIAYGSCISTVLSATTYSIFIGKPIFFMVLECQTFILM
jgi:hypothetical protein